MSRALARVLVLAAAATAIVAQGQVAADAAGRYCYLAEASSTSGGVAYTVKCVDVARGGSAGNGGGFVDTCRLEEWRANQLKIGPVDWPLFCDGLTLCMFRPPVEDPPAAAELAKQIPPGSGGTVIERFCIANYGDPNGPWSDGWTYFVGGVPPGPGLAARELAAHGNLVAPPASIGHSPNADAVVNLDTWFWLTGAPFAEFPGTPAFGVIAVGEPVNITWTYGDGEGEVDSCPNNGTSSASSCASHTYPRGSGRESNATFPVEAVRHYNVRYEMFALPLAIAPGVPTTFDATPVVAALGVLEVQAEVN